MRIANGNITFSSQQRYETVHEKSESFQMWIGSRPQRGEGLAPSSRSLGSDRVTLSEASRQIASCSTPSLPEVKCPEGSDESLRIGLVESLVKMLTGKEVKIVPLSLGDQDGTTKGAPEEVQRAEGEQKAGWGLVYDFKETYSESETLSWNAEGSIQTIDGDTISFRLSFSLSRSFTMEHSVHLRAGDARLSDPLVVNFGDGTIRFGDATYPFDLNGDGVQERIPFVSRGSGFLTLDRNNDNRINDGTELFGPTTGNGFAELAAYDDDGNRWIDEGDAVFQHLRVWLKGDSGDGVLLRLSEVGIAAISLERVIAPFHFKDGSGTLQAVMREGGVFLREDGTAGVIAQIDMAV